MKQLFNLLILFVFMVAFSAGCGNKADSGNVDSDVVSNNKTGTNPDAQNPEPVFTCEEPIWDFGKINEDEIVLHTFVFTNTGNQSLVISNCQASCGCTTPKCDQKPVAPGEKGEVEIKFDSKGKTNQQTKNITITANTNPPQTVLTITGFVIPK